MDDSIDATPISFIPPAFRAGIPDNYVAIKKSVTSTPAAGTAGAAGNLTINPAVSGYIDKDQSYFEFYDCVWTFKLVAGTAGDAPVGVEVNALVNLVNSFIESVGGTVTLNIPAHAGLMEMFINTQVGGNTTNRTPTINGLPGNEAVTAGAAERPTSTTYTDDGTDVVCTHETIRYRPTFGILGTAGDKNNFFLPRGINLQYNIGTRGLSTFGSAFKFTTDPTDKTIKQHSLVANMRHITTCYELGQTLEAAFQEMLFKEGWGYNYSHVTLNTTGAASTALSGNKVFNATCKSAQYAFAFFANHTEMVANSREVEVSTDPDLQMLQNPASITNISWTVSGLNVTSNPVRDRSQQISQLLDCFGIANSDSVQPSYNYAGFPIYAAGVGQDLNGGSDTPFTGPAIEHTGGVAFNISCGDFPGSDTGMVVAGLASDAFLTYMGGRVSIKQ